MTIRRGPAKSGRTTRLSHQPWRDPRLVLGVLLVLGATVLGATVVERSSSAVDYWALGSGVRAGEPVQRTDLVATQARLGDDAASHLLRTDQPLPATLDDLVWSRDVADGALLERSAMTRREGSGRTELPLTVARGAAPDDLRRGDRVDVWVGPGPGDDPDDRSVQALESVRIVSTGSKSSGVRAASARTVLVDVAGIDLGGSLVSTLAAGHVTMVRVS